MTTDTPSRKVRPIDIAQYGMLAFIVVSALGGAFTHMHDWTVFSIDAALKAAGRTAHTPSWFGWSNAIISELLPTSAFLSIRQRQRQGRSTKLPTWIFLGAACVSLLAQLSATGIIVPGAAQFLACLPAVAVLVLSKMIFADIEFAGAETERAAVEAAQAAEQAAERRRRDAEQAAERRRLAAEQAAEQAAELRRREAEQAAELERQAREHEAELAERQARIVAEAETRRLEIQAAERAAEREARERRDAREAELRRAAEVERARVEAEAAAELQRAEARRVEAEAELQRQAAARLAERQAQRQPAVRDRADGGAHEDVDTAGSRRMSKTERAELTAAALAPLPAGTTRDEAVAAVADALGVSRRYARDLVPADWAPGSSAVSSVEGEGEVPPRRHLSVAAAS